MKEKTFMTPNGEIHYYVDLAGEEKLSLIFLPGLTADHRLFDKQIEYFEGKANMLVWDAPAHTASRPFDMNFSLFDKAGWLGEILENEKLQKLVIIGQSMGGYVAQVYQEICPGKLKGFVSIDSAPLQKSYMSKAEIWSLKHTEGMYRMYPWKLLLKDGSEGCAVSEYGVSLMREMMEPYGSKAYSELAGHGYRILAEAVEADLPYEITCPAILICGEEDRAGFTRKYNEKWHLKTGLPLYWVKGAGHNSNTDRPEEINRLIEEFINTL